MRTPKPLSTIGMTLGFLILVAGLCFLAPVLLTAQDRAPFFERHPKRTIALHPSLHRAVAPPAPQWIPGKRASQYTAEDWGTLIDSTWGPGQSAAQQQSVFDTFWSTVDNQWAGFPNLPINWDSIRTVYRPQIGTGLSRGRFFALMSRVGMALKEHHTYIADYKVDSVFGLSPFTYRSGVPLLMLGSWAPDFLGAAVTLLPDSTNVVYRVVPGNPLGLEPGDLVLGYEGIPWKRLTQQMLDAGVPVSTLYSDFGSTPESITYTLLACVGWNWGMFDTIDVVKYKSGDTLHLPTTLLLPLTHSVWATDQLPIPGVPMPMQTPSDTATVTWGVVQGTNIGYVYAWDWWTAGTPERFAAAISDLRFTKKVDGLVIDFRMNRGGYSSFADDGFAQLFGFDPNKMISLAARNSTSDHMGFALAALSWGITPVGGTFDHPIAVLIGPGCWSAGDWNAFRMRFHPMTRFFGEPTNGGFVGGSYFGGTFSDAWYYYGPTNAAYSKVPGEGYLIHKGVQPDERVWLTRDGVANGEDDVVKRAIDWMTTLTYAHDAALDRTFALPGNDSVCISATLRNPLHHTTAISAIVTDSAGVVKDSVLLVNDGLHGDGSAGDSVWGAYIHAPSQKGWFDIAVRTDDLTAGTFRRVQNAARFKTNALFSDDFTPAAGTLLTSMGYTGNGETQNPIAVTSPGLSFYNYTTSGVGNAAALTTTGQDVYQSFPALSSGSVYLAFMANVSSAATGDFFIALSPTPLQTNYFARVFLKSSGSGYVVGLSKNFEASGGAIYGSTVLPFGSTALIVVKYSFIPGAVNDLMNVYVFNSTVPTTEPGTAEIANYGTASKADPANLAIVTLRQGTTGAAPALVIDGIRIDTTWPVAVLTGVGNAPVATPRAFALENNYPNPFNPTTTFQFSIPNSQLATLKVYDLLGREVAVLVNEEKPPGTYTVTWNAKGMASGVYFYQLRAGGQVMTKKMILIR